MIISLQWAPHLVAQPADKKNEQARDDNSDPHSPAYCRVNGVVLNVDAFYETYNVREGDAHYLPPKDRVRIWR